MDGPPRIYPSAGSGHMGHLLRMWGGTVFLEVLLWVLLVTPYRGVAQLLRGASLFYANCTALHAHKMVSFVLGELHLNQKKMLEVGGVLLKRPGSGLGLLP